MKNFQLIDKDIDVSILHNQILMQPELWNANTSSGVGYTDSANQGMDALVAANS